MAFFEAISADTVYLISFSLVIPGRVRETITVGTKNSSKLAEVNCKGVDGS